MGLIYIYLLGVLQASNKQTQVKVLDFYSPPPQQGRKAKENPCKWLKHIEKKKNILPVYVSMYTYT